MTNTRPEVVDMSAARGRVPRVETDAERREKYLGLALQRCARDETIGVTLQRAETIRAYIEAGALPEVTPASCVP